MAPFTGRCPYPDCSGHGSCSHVDGSCTCDEVRGVFHRKAAASKAVEISLGMRLLLCQGVAQAVEISLGMRLLLCQGVAQA